MASRFAALWTWFAGARGGTESTEPALEAVEYNGYRIRPAPSRAGDSYQTAGVIEKDFPDGVKEHRFIRAEAHSSRDAAAAFAIAKAKQIIDQQGDRVFAEQEKGHP
jgi:hypothetical protein